jgi:HlyD family secretion protein
LRTAKERARQISYPTAVDVTNGRLDLSKARADLETQTRKPTPSGLAAARLAVDVATQRLAQTNGPATAVDVSTARAELAKAQADLDALQAPSTTAVQAAQLAVTLAQQRIAELAPGAAASDGTAAQLELKKAQADLEALQSGPRAAALAAAQASVDLAAQKVAEVTGPPTPLAVASAQLDLEKARADVEALLRAVGGQALAAGRTAVRLAQQRLTRLLHPTAAALDAGRADVAKAVADLETLLRRGAPAGPIDIGIARLKVQAAAAHLSAAQLQVEHLTIRAPAGGTVTGLLAVPGAPTDPSTPIATVADLRHLAVSVDLSEFDIARVRRGEAALLSVDALGGKQLPGRVVFVALTGADNGGVVTFPVGVALTRAASVKPGMNVSVKIIVAQRRNIVIVPLDAVTGQTVTVVDAGGRTSRRRVVVGLADNKHVEIRSGVRPGERVLLGTGGG